MFRHMQPSTVNVHLYDALLSPVSVKHFSSFVFLHPFLVVFLLHSVGVLPKLH